MRDIVWHRAVGTRLTAILFVVGALGALLLVLGLRDFRRLSSELAWVNEAGKVRRAAYGLLYDSARLPNERGSARARVRASIHERSDELERQLVRIARGDPERGLRPATDSSVRDSVRDLERRWAELEPALDRLASEDELVEPAERHTIELLLREQAADANEAVERALRADAERSRQAAMLGFALVAAILALLAVAVVLARQVARRTRGLAAVAQRVGRGELLVRAPTHGQDELAALGSAFNSMTTALRERIESEREARGRLDRVLDEVRRTAREVAASSRRIVEASERQSNGAQKQATSAAETAAGTERLSRSAADATARAHAVVVGAKRSESTGRAGAEAAQAAVDSMQAVRARMAAIRAVVDEVAHRARAVGDIVATVDGMAAQTQLVALNATIEAARAGPHGRSFAVVAAEVKELAERSRKATVHVREVLGDILRAVEEAVSAAEEGSSTAEGAGEVIERAGLTIRELAAVIADAARLATGIEETVGSQAEGVAEIRAAVRAIDEAATHGLDATRQAEDAARELDALAVRLRELLAA